MSKDIFVSTLIELRGYLLITVKEDTVNCKQKKKIKSRLGIQWEYTGCVYGQNPSQVVLRPELVEIIFIITSNQVENL